MNTVLLFAFIGLDKGRPFPDRVKFA